MNIKEKELSDDIKNGITEKPSAIAYIEENYPETAKEFQRLQFEQWLLFCKNRKFFC